MNPIAITAAAQRSAAAYNTDVPSATAAFAALGYTLMGFYKNLTHQAVLSRDARNQFYLSITGTRYDQPGNLDLLADLSLSPVNVPKGGQVASGVYEGLGDMWNWVLNQVPIGSVINIDGHSLGAERTLLTPIFLSKPQIGDLYAFEAPMCATQAYWDAYRDELAGAVHTVCGLDIWFSYPPHQGYCHDAQSSLLWLQSTAIKLITPPQFPGGLSGSDHAITEVVARLQNGMTNALFPH